MTGKQLPMGIIGKPLKAKFEQKTADPISMVFHNSEALA